MPSKSASKPTSKPAQHYCVIRRYSMLTLIALVFSAIAVAATPAFVPGQTADAANHAYRANPVGNEFGERPTREYAETMEGVRSSWDDIEPDILLIGRKTGRVSYRAKTNTLTLKGVKAQALDISSGKTVRIVLKGKNRIDEGIDCSCGDGDDGTRLTITGNGSLLIKKKGNRDCNGIAFGYWGSKRKRASQLTIKSGTVKLVRCDIDIVGGNLVMTGGKLKVSKGGVNAKQDYYPRRKFGGSKPKKQAKFGGKISHKGGSITSDYISGKMMTFVKDGNKYKCENPDLNKNVQLVKYHSRSKRVALDKVKFCKRTFQITDIAEKAFNTKQGRKIETLTVKNELEHIRANAFAGTKSLERLTFAKNVGTLKTGAFTGTGAKAIVFEGGVGKVKRGAFAKATRPIEAKFSTISYGTKLEKGAFSGSYLRSLSFLKLNSDVSLKPGMFDGASCLRSLTIGSGSRNVNFSKNVLKGLRSLTNLEIDYDIWVSKDTFANAPALTSITLRGAECEPYAFASMNALKSLSFTERHPSSKNALSDTKNLSELHLRWMGNEGALDGKGGSKSWLSDCGKDGGRGLIVFCHTISANNDPAVYKTALIRDGLSPNARVKILTA